jgi:dTDP-4-dehydrorhamnose reductase
MTELLVFGADSLVGSHFVGQTSRSIAAAGRRDPRDDGLSVAEFAPVDLARPEAVERLVRDSGAETVVNFAAATDVDGVERERPAPPASEGGAAWAVNARAPEAMARAARASGKRLIHLSTDFVFDGTAGPYAEDAEPSPFGPQMSWYGWSKSAGETAVRRALGSAVVVRIAYPFRAKYPRKTDLARGLIARYRAGTLPPLFDDQLFTPTWVPDVSRALEHLLERGGSGTYHVASPEATSPFEFGSALLERVAGRPPAVARGSMEGFLKRPGVTPRPRRGGLVVERLRATPAAPTGWSEAIERFVAEGGAGS